MVDVDERELNPEAEACFFAGVDYANKFFMDEADVHRALLKVVRLLEEAGIPYAIIGAMALNEFGYRRVMQGIDLLLTRDGLEAFRTAHLGRGYVEKFPGSRGLHDTEHHVDLDVVVAGTYPGDGRPKPIVFPDPATTAERGARVALLPLAKLIVTVHGGIDTTPPLGI